MDVVVNRSALLEALSAAAGIAVSRTTKEILKCVRLTTVPDGLVLGATDLELGLRGLVRQVEVKQQGDLLVPAEKLLQIVRESVDETLAIQGADQTCHIRGQDSHFEVYGQDPKEFPPIPELEGTPDVELDAAALAGVIEKTVFAVARENTRYAINGVLWEKEGKKLVLVATDGRRLAWASGPIRESAGKDRRMIVPAKAMHALQRVLGSVEGTVTVQFSSNQVVLGCGPYVLSSVLVEGHFPQYEEVIPGDSDKTVELGTDDFYSAVRRAALLTNEQSKGIRLAFSEGKLVLSSRAPEQGEATVSMAIDYTSAPLEIGFNPSFLADSLRVAGTPVVQLELKDPNRPGVLKAGRDFLYVIMPVNLS